MAVDLAGLGSITADPMMPRALRMRRFYVQAVFRRHGVGRRPETLIASVHPGVYLVVNAGTQHAARFWEALGFMADRHDGHPHTLPWRGG
jgi:hypothetical protein